jgi:hypothetical protein
MSRRSTVFFGLFSGNLRDFDMFVIGARIASSVRLRGIPALACLLVSGCLVTDQAELDPIPKTPPIVLAADTALGSIIRFNVDEQIDLRIPLHIRYENTLAILKPRFRVITAGKTPSAFECPEHPIIPNGELIRDGEIVINRMDITRGACSEIEFVVSASFLACEKHPPEVFDVTTADDDDFGRATFWVWETSTDPLTNPMAARALIATCPTSDSTTQTTTMSQP